MKRNTIILILSAVSVLILACGVLTTAKITRPPVERDDAVVTLRDIATVTPAAAITPQVLDASGVKPKEWRP